MKTVEIFLIPSLFSTIRNMGIEDDYDEDMDWEAVSFQQGWDIESIKISSGETFTIDDNWEKAVLDCEGNTYILIKKLPWGESEVLESDDKIHFEMGEYLFHEDGKTFELLEDL